MFPLSIQDFFLCMAASLFILGVLCIIAGIVVLVSRVIGNDITSLTREATGLGQKGIAEDIAGLVGNASALVESINQLIRTSSGVGVFLILMGFVLAVSSYLLVVQVQ